MKLRNDQQFAEFKQRVLSKNIKRKRVSLSEINIISDSVAKYAGLTFKLSESAFKSLMRHLNISKGFRDNLIKEFGTNFVDKLISIMSSSIKNRNLDVVMLVDLNTKTILNFLPNDEFMISNDQFFTEIEKIVNGYNLDVRSINSSDDGGFSVSTLSPSSDWGLAGLSDEVFKFGVTFKNDPSKGTIIAPFNERLVCTNGMTQQKSLGSVKLMNTKESWEYFYQSMNGLNKQGFRPADFGALVKNSISAKASVLEVERSRNIIKSLTTLDDNSLETYLPYQETLDAYQRVKTPIETMSKDMKKNAVSSISYWDLINDITYIASNVSGVGLKRPDKLQLYAGDLLSKTPDTCNLVASPF